MFFKLIDLPCREVIEGRSYGLVSHERRGVKN